MDGPALAVVKGYHGLLAAAKARKEALGMSDRDLEDIADLTAGHWSKIVAHTKSLGPLSMGRILRALGLQLLVAEDVEQTAKIAELYRRRDETKVVKRSVIAMATVDPPPWLLNREKARKLRANQLARLSKEERSRIAKKAWRSRRRRMREGVRECV